MVGFEDIHKNDEVNRYIEESNEVLGAIGYTEHGFAHCKRTADISGRILRKMGYDERTCELAKIAGYMHDIGNMINRVDHAQSSALIAFSIMQRLGFSIDEIAKVTSAIGHHDEKTAAAVSPIAAALILADKSDVRRTRVRKKGTVLTDIHDRVNFAVRKSDLKIEAEEKHIILELVIDTDLCPVMEYFGIFLERMVLCKKAANYLEYDFELIINETRLL
ncbi:MAG TPA: HD domain-containing protein [Clostridia bacterium]|nr:HD domain-containing protein [Clostridia bacterium]